jgi:trans-aconitate methyltransferase
MEFDKVASSYNGDLEKGIKVSGFSKEYFAEERVRFMSKILQQAGKKTACAVDYGCGIGTAIPFLQKYLKAHRLVGVDISEDSLQIARQQHPKTEFMNMTQVGEEIKADLIYCNGVFHHILPRERISVAQSLWQMLSDGGWLVIWENNSWNIGARYVMKRIPFDRDAVMVSAMDAKNVLNGAGFQIYACYFKFIFPHFLKIFAGLENKLVKFPLGAQYQIIGIKSNAK